MTRLLQGGQISPQSAFSIDQGSNPVSIDIVTSIPNLRAYPGQVWQITTIRVQLHFAISSIGQPTFNNVLATVLIAGFAIAQIPLVASGVASFTAADFVGVTTLLSPAEVLAGDSFTLETNATYTTTAGGGGTTTNQTGGVTLIGERDRS